MNDELNPAPLANGHAEGLGPVPVMGTEPVVAKPKRKRKKKAAPKVARAPKIKPDPIRDAFEASKASATIPGNLQSAQPHEEAPTSSIVQGVGADHFVEARERRLERMFDADARTTTAPPIKSSWRERFVFGLRRMTGFDSSDNSEPFTLGVALKTFLVACVIVSGAGVYMAWF